MKNKTALAFILGGIAGTTMLAGSFAYQGTHGQSNPNSTVFDRHEQMQEIIENQDYESFQELFGENGPARLIDSQEKFEKWIEIQNLFEAGDTEQAKSLSDELGLGHNDMHRQMHGGFKGHRGVNGEMYEQMKGQTFEEFQDMVADSPIAEDIDTEEKFQKLIDMHEAMQENNFTEAKAIRQELGVSFGGVKNSDCPMMNGDGELQKNASDRGKMMGRGGMMRNGS